ncbi:MAG TPA: type I DNA topoisomerase [Chitinophagales bacterium]|nr:type I DNA topoisomerase [Chitinophagales bacterium]
MAQNLLIVESPAKAKTIEKFLGKEFKVASSFGHIRDLAKEGMGVDIKNGYEPTYEIPEEKMDTVKQLKKLAKSAEEVWLATDEDREGEAISWHLCEVLGLDPIKAKRIVFHEITKQAIEEAVKNPRGIDLNLVNAQQARRVLDRLVGFELSPILWRKISMRQNLSAGRVQSVAVRLIVEREREINAFRPESTFRISALFNVHDDGKISKLKAESPKKLADETAAMRFLQEANGARFTITDIQTKPAKKYPPAPFTTSTLQQEASRKLSFSVLKTMTLAQRLYESGYITYMRTDSVNLSQFAIDAAAAEITKSFGGEYSEPRQYKTKSRSAQEAHEAIRPTFFNKREIEGERDEQRLYELIWKRAVASQMAEARMEKTTVKIDISTNHEELVAEGEVLLFDGFLKLYMESQDEEPDEEHSGMLPPLKTGQSLALEEMVAREKFSKAPPRYNEASLVKKMEELGIGRPSTYAPTITTIQKRGYVEKRDKEGKERQFKVLTLKSGAITATTETEITGAEKAKLFPTDVGAVVNDFLAANFSDVMDYNFTARIEEEFDEIAAGKMKWAEMIDDFYKPFHKDVEQTINTAERASGERELGTDPESGKVVLVRIGKYGPMAQIGKPDDEEKPRYARLRANQSIETITLEEALQLFKLPRNLGEYEGKEVVASIGRFGPYIRHDGKFISVPKEYDVYEIGLDEAVTLIENKRKFEAEKNIRNFPEKDIHILKGRFGPYIKAGDKNYRIPKDKDAYALTLEDCLQIIETTPESKKRGGFKKTSKKNKWNTKN